MYPYLNLGPLHLGTFGLLLWLAAVAGTIVLHRNFVRKGVDARCAERRGGGGGGWRGGREAVA